MSDDTIELSEVESFSFLFKCLWSEGAPKRQNAHILDTVLFKAGRPARWLFTGNDGSVLKRKDENLNAQEIIRMFKSKSRSGQGSKHYSLKSKIAIVWFVNQRNQISHYLVDDLQLQSILNDDAIYEILAVQLYIGGHPMKGSGVFEHRMYLRNAGGAQHSTQELVSTNGHDLTTFSQKVERLTVTQTQHETLKALSQRIAARISKVTKGQVANIVLQVAFTTSWIPVIVCARSILVWHPDASLTLYRSESLHAVDPPIPPSPAIPGSMLLPHPKIETNFSESKRATRDHPYSASGVGVGETASAIQESPGSSPTKRPSRPTSPVEGPQAASDLSKQELRAMFDVISGTDGSYGENHKLQKHHAEKQKLTTADFKQPLNQTYSKIGNEQVKDPFKGLSKASDYNGSELVYSDVKKQNDRFFNGAGRRPLGASATGTYFPETMTAMQKRKRHNSTLVDELEDVAIQGKKDSEFDKQVGVNRRGSTLTALAAKVPKDKASAFRYTRQNEVPSGSERYDKKHAGSIHKHSAYAQTAASRARLEFYVSQLKAAEELPVERALKARRGIAAPHGSYRGVGVDSGKHGVAEGGTRSSGFVKKAPLMSGSVCFGDYCFLNDEQAVQMATNGLDDEAEPPRVTHDSSVIAEEKSGDALPSPSGLDGGTSLSAVAGVPTAVPARTDGGSPPAPPKKVPMDDGYGLSEHDLKPKMLRFQVPYRSVLTMRSEEDFLTAKLYEDWPGDNIIDQLPDPTKNAQFQVQGHQRNLLELTLRHLRRVGYCCLSDVRRTVMPMKAPHQSGSGFDTQWQNLSAAYRRLIYVDALAKTHPSRFYQTVPVCDTCQFVYTMADQRREEIVFDEDAAQQKTRRKKIYKARETSNGIEEARIKGRLRREAADKFGQERNSPGKKPEYNKYGAGRDDAVYRFGDDSSRCNSFQNDEYDRLFDSTFVEDGELDPFVLDQGDGVYFGEDGEEDANAVGEEAVESGLVSKLKSETAESREREQSSKGPIQIGISTEGGAISSWVKMLSDTDEAPVERISSGASSKRRAQSAGVTRSKRSAVPEKARDSGNPMGPLAGQGIGGPKGQYRDHSAPVGYMLGQTAGTVGSKFIDAKGNIIHLKRRSPADRGTSDANKYDALPENSSFLDGPGIAYVKKDKNSTRPKSALVSSSSQDHKNNSRQSHKQKSNFYDSSAEYKVGAINRSGETKARPKSAVASSSTRRNPHAIIQNTEAAENALRAMDMHADEPQEHLMDIGAYTFKSLKNNQSDADKEPSNTQLRNVSSIDEYRFDKYAAPGSGGVPFLPLTTRPHDMRRRQADTYALLEEKDNPPTSYQLSSQLVYEGGSAAFEDMITKAAEELDVLPTSLPKRPSSKKKMRELNIGNLDRSLSRDRIKYAQELKRIQAEKEEDERISTGYLGGLKIAEKVNNQNNIYQAEMKLPSRKPTRKLVPPHK